MRIFLKKNKALLGGTLKEYNVIDDYYYKMDLIIKLYKILDYKSNINPISCNDIDKGYNIINKDKNLYLNIKKI